MNPRFLIYASALGWRESLKKAKFRFSLESEEGLYERPDFLLFGKCELNEIYDVLKMNPDLRCFLGELSVNEVENKRALNVISTAYSFKILNLNLKDFGFTVNRRLDLFYGIRKSNNSQEIIDDYERLLKAITAELRTTKSEVINFKNHKDVARILKAFGYEKESKKREVCVDNAIDVTPLKIYEILINSFAAFL